MSLKQEYYLLCQYIGEMRSPRDNMQLVVLSAYFFLPLVVYLLPKEMIFGGNTVCLSKLIFNHECFGCGMTRAVYSLIHGDLYGAIGYNWRVIIVAPLLFVVYIEQILSRLSLAIIPRLNPRTAFGERGAPRGAKDFDAA